MHVCSLMFHCNNRARFHFLCFFIIGAGKSNKQLLSINSKWMLLVVKVEILTECSWIHVDNCFQQLLLQCLEMVWIFWDLKIFQVYTMIEDLSTWHLLLLLQQLMRNILSSVVFLDTITHQLFKVLLPSHLIVFTIFTKEGNCSWFFKSFKYSTRSLILA